MVFPETFSLALEIVLCGILSISIQFILLDRRIRLGLESMSLISEKLGLDYGKIALNMLSKESVV